MRDRYARRTGLSEARICPAEARPGRRTCQNLPAFDGHRIAKGLPLAAGSMGVAHATRICALVLNPSYQPSVAPAL
jgi:hypothetical protein